MVEGKKYSILAVDDEIYNLEALERTFRREYSLITTTSPHEAIQIFQSEPIDLIIADQRMPEMSGTELLAQLKIINPEPIRIVLSAYTDISYLIDAINHGEVYRYITKPWDPNDLRLSIQKALEYYQANKERLRLTAQLQEANQLLAERNAELERAMRELQETQEKMLQMERFSVIGKMSGMILHDLKQPLDIIRSAADTMTRHDLSLEERREFSDMIRYETSRFLELIQSFLEYSRGNFQLNKEELSIEDFWELLKLRLTSYIKSQPIQFRLITDDQEGIVQVDRHQMTRVFVNLIQNAIDAAGAQPHPLEVEITGKREDGKFLLTVRDNGPGIPEADLPHIFQPFFSRKKTHGVGLGLAIVKQIVEQHQGKISVESRPGGGTTFTIYLNCQNGYARTT